MVGKVPHSFRHIATLPHPKFNSTTRTNSASMHLFSLIASLLSRSPKGIQVTERRQLKHNGQIMSIDIDWSLLSPPLPSTSSPQPSATTHPANLAHPPSSLSLAATLVSLLNTHLSSPSLPRPSFIGPITILDFHFGSTGPDVELKDVRDVWRAFEEDQDSPMSSPMDDDLEGESDLGQVERAVYPASTSPAYGHGHRNGHGHAIASTLDDEPYELVQPNMRLQDLVERQRELEHEMLFDHEEDAEVMSVMGLRASASVAGAGVPRAPSVFSLGSPSIAHVGIGASIARSRAASHDYGAARPGMGTGPFSPSMSFRPPSTYDDLTPTPLPLHPHVFPSTDTTPPPSPPAHPRDIPGHSTSARGGRSANLPSLQLHLRYHHRSDLCLTLQTSLQVNYPSVGFMALPLKLSIVGMTLRAEVVLAFDAERNRVHLCVVDEEDGEDDAEGTVSKSGGQVPIGQKILPSLTMETEIGDKDTHVLRNVGKVERFIGDVVRKTLVDELVWPNFHTIQL